MYVLGRILCLPNKNKTSKSSRFIRRLTILANLLARTFSDENTYGSRLVSATNFCPDGTAFTLARLAWKLSLLANKPEKVGEHLHLLTNISSVNKHKNPQTVCRECRQTWLITAFNKSPSLEMRSLFLMRFCRKWTASHRLRSVSQPSNHCKCPSETNAGAVGALLLTQATSNTP